MDGLDMAGLRSLGLDDRTKAMLTTALVDRRHRGDVTPMLDAELLGRCKELKRLSSADRADRLLRYLADLQKHDPDEHPPVMRLDDPGALAHSESWNANQISHLVRHLIDRGWVERLTHTIGEMNCSITVAGDEHLRKLQSADDDTGATRNEMAFVAMWFADEMDDPYDRGIAPAIRDAGYEPDRIDRRRDVDRIDDAILDRIREARFVVADMTHGPDGVRGSVYYEAGYARGVGRDVIYCCRKDCLNGLPFDTRQHRHIVWSEPDELRRELAKTIPERVGRVT